MGLALSCPLADFDDLDFEAVLVRSFSYREEDERNSLRSLSFNGRDSEPVLRRSYDSRKFIFEGSLSFKGREMQTVFSFRSPSATMENDVFGRSMSYKRQDSGVRMQRSENFCEKNTPSPKPGIEKYQAAVKLQKCYRSFRTRRRLADCAVIVEQRWWKLLDFAELRCSSISFFDIEKHETAASRWSRARTRAAKVGKGLSKDEKARKLALQHWLEAIDPRHRYGHNLQFYYVRWLHCQSKQPFFYWLDIGEGKEVNLEKCPRSKLLQQCIKYLGPAEREEYEVAVEEGKFFYKQNGELLDTVGGPRDGKWIFVLSTSKSLYVGLKSKGTFQHSSFLAGGATLSAGRLVVENGILKAVWPHSGHYLPTEENFEEFMSFLREHNVDLAIVKKCPSEEEEEALTRRSNGGALLNEKAKSNDRITAQDHAEFRSSHGSNSVEKAKPRISRLPDGLSSKITKLEIPKRNDAFEVFNREILARNCQTLLKDTPSEDGYETAEESFLSEEEFMVPKVNLFGEDHSDDHNRAVPKEKILRRIDSHKGMKSYQLAQQLSSKWATGAGPRIGCMRDYPSELQFRVLEEANLSPKATSVHSFSQTPSRFSPKVLTPTSLCREATTTGRNTLRSRTATP